MISTEYKVTFVMLTMLAAVLLLSSMMLLEKDSLLVAALYFLLPFVSLFLLEMICVKRTISKNASLLIVGLGIFDLLGITVAIVGKMIGGDGSDIGLMATLSSSVLWYWLIPWLYLIPFGCHQLKKLGVWKDKWSGYAGIVATGLLVGTYIIVEFARQNNASDYVSIISLSWIVNIMLFIIFSLGKVEKLIKTVLIVVNVLYIARYFFELFCERFAERS